MKRRIIYILSGLMFLSICGFTTSCSSSSNLDEYGMRKYNGKKNQKVRSNYKVKGWGDAGNKPKEKKK